MLDIFTGKCQKNEVSKNVFISLILTVIMNIIIKLADILTVYSLVTFKIIVKVIGLWARLSLLTTEVYAKE